MFVGGHTRFAHPCRSFKKFKKYWRLPLFPRIFTLLPVLSLLAGGLFAQGINTPVSTNDWEEINFEYNSSVLVDGFPSLLRLGELLQKNAGFRVTVEGHTDAVGANAYNETLGLARANSVRDFLVKYGARPAQISVTSRGKEAPKYTGEKGAYSRTDEARWMNRRVALTVLDEQGRTVGAGGAGDAIRALQPTPAAGMTDCCNEVLKRLDKLDAIERMLMDLADQNRRLANELAALKQNQDTLASRVNQPPPAPAAAPAPAAMPRVPSTDEVAKAVTDALDKKTLPKFQLMGVNVGANNNGDVTFTGKGRYFAPFGNNYAFQSEGEYFYNKGQREGQFDFGLVDRINRFQVGLFGSFKHVNLTGDQTGGTIGQAAFTADYLFQWGKIGAFGTKAFLDDALVNRTLISSSFALERYLRVVDQAGVSGNAPLFGNNYLEGNLGYLRSTTAGDRVGGTLRLIFPVTDKIAFTLEGGMNETLLGRGNNGRAVAGLQFGNRLQPRDFLTSNHPIPVQIPRIRYEVLTRTARIGNQAPVADAGPNQALPGSATVTLNGSRSYDPDGDPITFQWVQESGPTVPLSAPTAAVTTFAAAVGQNYAFRLTVKDSLGAQGVARVTVAAGNPAPPQIINFTANPTAINAGQSSTLRWQVINADTVSITSLGTVALSGSSPVSPTTTTTYTLTATRGTQTATATATVTVNAANSLPRIISFAPNPATIDYGKSSELSWVVENATKVDITTLGTVGLTGSHRVSPVSTITYTLTASNAAGSVTATTTITVITSVKILSFTATPATVASGNNSILVCETIGAATVNIAGVEFRTSTAVAAVRVINTTTYTCTATAANGQIATAQTTVTVVGPIDP
ncbi:MAG: OmpA family protein [Bryobacterales bacterium]|nr:OmpA family protein [Bryobacterales bacterium]